MGAYYIAVLWNHKTIVKPAGFKLMDHSYFDTSAIGNVLKLLKKKPSRLTWLCDYNDEISWNDLMENKEFKIITSKEEPIILDKEKFRYLINLDRKECVDLEITRRLNAFEPAWSYHPLPLLTNSELETAGGGDFHYYTPIRSRWKNEMISVCSSKPNFFKDITGYCVLREDEGIMSTLYSNVPFDFEPDSNVLTEVVLKIL